MDRFFFTAVLASAAALSGTPARAAGDTIPALHGVVLTGSVVDLPQALSGKEGVLVIGFSQSSREEVTAWGRRLAWEYRDSNRVIYYEMPVLAGVPKLLRGWVLKKVSEGVPERAKSRCLPVLDHEADWKAAAGYAKDEDAYILLVDSAGRVTWRTQGPLDDAHFAELKRRLQQ